MTESLILKRKGKDEDHLNDEDADGGTGNLDEWKDEDLDGENAEELEKNDEDEDGNY